MNSVTIASLLQNKLINPGYSLTIGDRRGLPMHPAITAGYFGDLAGAATTTATKDVSNIGVDQFAADAEGVGPAPTDLVFSQLSATIAWYSLSYDTTTAMRTLKRGLVDPGTIIGEGLAVSAGMTLVNSLASLGSGFTASTSTTGAANSVATMMAAIAQLGANMRGPFFGILYHKQWSDFTTNLAAVLGSGSLQFNSDPEIAAIRGSAFKGEFMGVDWSVSNQVPTANAGADSSGFITGPEGIVWASATPAVDFPDRQLLLGAGGSLPLLIDLGRDGRAGVTELTGRINYGVATGLQNGTRLITDR